MYDTEESATRLAIGRPRRYNASNELESAARLAFGQQATHMYDTEESANHHQQRQNSTSHISIGDKIRSDRRQETIGFIIGMRQ